MRRRQYARGGMGVAMALSALLGLCGSGRAGQTPAEKSDTILWQDTFETGAGSWSALGPNGKVSVTTDSALVKSGKGALAFAYLVGGKPEAGKDSAVPIDVLYRPTPNGELAKM